MQLRSVYVVASKLTPWDDNPKRHDINALKASIVRYGFRDAPIWDATLGALVGGNGRTHAVVELEAGYDGARPPAGIMLEDGTGRWCIPVQMGIDAATRGEAEAFAVDHNNLTMQGSDDFTPFDIAMLWDRAEYDAVLERLADLDSLPLTMDAETQAMMLADLPEYVAGGIGGDDDHDLETIVFRMVISMADLEHTQALVTEIQRLQKDKPLWGLVFRVY